jgi:molybdopterin converting factor small subunit
MRVTLKLFAYLGDFLPPDAERNAISLELPEAATIGDLLSKHQVPRGTCHLILVNGHYAPPARADQTHLKDGDTVAVWPPIAGG